MAVGLPGFSGMIFAQFMRVNPSFGRKTALGI
jgi:hypothetical protein